MHIVAYYSVPVSTARQERERLASLLQEHTLAALRRSKPLPADQNYVVHVDVLESGRPKPDGVVRITLPDNNVSEDAKNAVATAMCTIQRAKHTYPMILMWEQKEVVRVNLFVDPIAA